MRSDLPGYLADSEADGVCEYRSVWNIHSIHSIHRCDQLLSQAVQACGQEKVKSYLWKPWWSLSRYFLDDTDYLYFHSYMSDYFLGTYGGGGFSFSIHLFPLRHPQAFPLHRDPEAHLPPEEQGRQQRQTSGNGRKKYNSISLIRCLPCLWPITTDRESWQGAWPHPIFLFRTYSTFHLTFPPT